MLSKIYLALLGISIAVIAFFTYYSWSWLQSIGQPAAAVAGYEYHAGFAGIVLWISVLGLMSLGSSILWTTGRSWAVWTTFVYFAVLVATRYFLMDPTFLQFRKASGLADAGFSAAPLFAVILIVLMAAIAFFSQFIILRLRAKTYGEAKEEEVEKPAETIPE